MKSGSFVGVAVRHGCFEDVITRRLSSGRLTHVKESLGGDGEAGTPCMVDVSEKKTTSRIARAQAKIFLPREVCSHLNLSDGVKEVMAAKGPVFSTAIIAGTMACKHTFSLIPFCHQIPIESCDISCTILRTENNDTAYSKSHPFLIQVEAQVCC